MSFELNNYALDINKKVISRGQCVDKDVIKQSIETILMTDRYERVFEPNFGSFLSGIVFEQLTSSDASKLLDDIIALIKRFETRVRILDNRCKMKVDVVNHILDITIVYIINNGSIEEFNKRIVF